MLQFGIVQVSTWSFKDTKDLTFGLTGEQSSLTWPQSAVRQEVCGRLTKQASFLEKTAKDAYDPKAELMAVWNMEHKSKFNFVNLTVCLSFCHF